MTYDFFIIEHPLEPGFIHRAYPHAWGRYKCKASFIRTNGPAELTGLLVNDEIENKDLSYAERFDKTDFTIRAVRMTIVEELD